MEQLFESERISYTSVSEDLIEDYLFMVNDYENVNRFIGGMSGNFTRDQEIAWVRDRLEEKAPVYSMIEKKSGRFIGNIELMDMDGIQAELGIAITAVMQNKGYGTEAVSAMTRYGFGHFGLKRICLRANPRNARAIRVYEKCGFREYDRNDSHVFMELTAEEGGVPVVRLVPMTDEMYFSFFREYEFDPDLLLPGQAYVPYEYSEEKAERYILRQRSLGRIPLAIMLGDEIAGEIVIKDIKPRESAAMGITMKNPGYKDRGIGTEAERLAVRYVFGKLDVPVLYADVLKSNGRSRHVLEKTGFVFVREEGDFLYYRADRAGGEKKKDNDGSETR